MTRVEQKTELNRTYMEVRSSVGGEVWCETVQTSQVSWLQTHCSEWWRWSHALRVQSNKQDGAT